MPDHSFGVLATSCGTSEQGWTLATQPHAMPPLLHLVLFCASPKSHGLMARLGLSGSQAKPSQTTWAQPGLGQAWLLTAQLRLSHGSGQTLHDINPYIHQTLILPAKRGWPISGESYLPGACHGPLPASLKSCGPHSSRSCMRSLASSSSSKYSTRMGTFWRSSWMVMQAR